MPSTVIRRFTYAADKRELCVEFVTGRVYVYAGVPEEEAQAMRAAFAKGRYFNAHIRDRYACREINAPGAGSP
jgi:lysyl-tRNA synthetase class 2